MMHIHLMSGVNGAGTVWTRCPPARRRLQLWLTFGLFLAQPAWGALTAEPDRRAPPLSEIRGRREAVAALVQDGVLLIHSATGFKRWEDYGFRQDSNFYYLTGLINLHDAILAIDGSRHETILFVRTGRAPVRGLDAQPALRGLESVTLAPGEQSERLTGVSRVADWSGFSAWLDGRLAAQPGVALYLDDAGQNGQFAGETSNPPELPPIDNPHLIWRRVIHDRWPGAKLEPAHELLNSVRAVKSEYEIAMLRTAARQTLAGIRAAAASVRPGVTQRQLEGTVVAAMMQAGAEGPGFWPWVKSGRAAFLPGLWQSFVDYHGLNRRMSAGELVRLNIGAEFGMYKGDYGRTLPVSPGFDAGQRETLDLLNGAYLAGLALFRPGASQEDVIAASVGFVNAHKGELKTALARRAATILATRDPWSMYGHGIDMVEGVPTRFAAGNVICWAPEFSVEGQGFFVEDTVLVVPGGHALISPPLPYGSRAIEAFKARLQRPRKGRTALPSFDLKKESS